MRKLRSLKYLSIVPTIPQAAGMLMILAASLAASLSACAGSPPGPSASPPAASSTPATINLPVVPVAPSPQAPTSPPSATLPPTAPLPPSPTSSPDPLVSPTATSDIAQMGAQMGRDSWLSLSPDGTWQAEIEVAFPAISSEESATPAPSNPQYYTKLVLRHASGSPAWTVVDEWREFGLGAATPQVFFWSPKNDFVLIADSATPDGCAIFPHLSRLRRVDLATGAIQTWASDLQGVLAINPAGDSLIVFQNPTPNLRLVDVNSSRQHIGRAERQLSYTTLLGEWQAGGAHWNPAGNLMAFTVYPAACPPDTTYIYTLDPLSGEIELILDGAAGWLDITDWTERGLILGDRGGSRWLLDPLADTLTPLP